MTLGARVRHVLRRNLRDDELGRAGIGLALALLTVLAACIAGLQGQASIEAQRGNREAQRIGLEAAGNEASAVVQVGAAYGAYRRWFEQLERSNWATDQLTRDPNSPNKALLQTLADADAAIAAWVKTQSTLLQPPYKSANDTDFSAYEADTVNAPAAKAAAQRAVEADVASAWDSKAAQYVTVLTVLAVGLFLLGLASTVRRRARPVLASAGLFFGVVSLVWTLSILLAPIHRVPQEAIDQLVASQASLDRAPGAEGEATLPAKSREMFETAIRQADQAIALDPSYLAAFLTRAEARVFFGDAITFTSGPSDESRQILAAGAADYRTYLAGHPDDYAAWWNLGWADYLVGDQRNSIDATNQALIRSPGQFALYLNRALAFLAGGDPKQARDDIDEAIRRAGLDSTASATWYLGQSDFNIAKLADGHPAEAETLRSVQLRLREAQVALRVTGSVTPATDAPALSAVTIKPVQLRRYAGGTLDEGAALGGGGHVATTDAVGVRVGLTGLTALKGRTVSARIWLDGLPSPEYTRDVTVDADTLTIDLISPYGLAGFDFDPGDYTLDLYVDGARRYQANWTVDPRPDKPQYSTLATPLLAGIKTDGFGCDQPATADGKSTVNCSIRDNDQTVFIIDVTYDAQDRITYVVLGTITADASTSDVDKVAHQFFGYAVKKLFPADIADRAVTWIDGRGTAVDDIDMGGTTLRVYGADTHVRNMDIWSPWP